jgi:hypothetical protein
MGRSAWAMVVLSAIALVLMLSIVNASGAGHGLVQITLALPIFFLLLLLATSTGDWLQTADLFVEPKPRLSASLTRGPPA